MQTIKIKELDLDLCFIDEKSGYIFLDKPFKTRVLANYNNKLKLSFRS